MEPVTFTFLSTWMITNNWLYSGILTWDLLQEQGHWIEDSLSICWQGLICWICPLWTIISSLLSLIISFWLISKRWVCLPAETFLTPQFCTLQTETSCSNRSLIHLTAIKWSCCATCEVGKCQHVTTSSQSRWEKYLKRWWNPIEQLGKLTILYAVDKLNGNNGQVENGAQRERSYENLYYLVPRW